MAEVHPETQPNVPPPRVGRGRTSLSTRIRLVVFLSTFLTAAIVSAIAIDALHRGLRSKIDEHLPRLLERRASALAQQIDSARGRLARDLVESGAPVWRLDRRAAVEETLAEIVARHPTFAGLAILGDGGEAPALTGGTLDAETARAIAAATAADAGRVRLAVVDDGTEARVGTRIDLRADAIVVAAFDRRAIEATLHLDADEGPGHLRLTDSDEPWATAEGDDDAQTPGAVAEYASGDGVGMFGAVRPVGETGLHLVVEAPVRVVFAPLLDAATRIALWDATVILVFSLLALRITRAIMQPIEALSESAARIARGDVDHDIPEPRSRDELGLLTRSFNEMLRKLRRSQEEIEDDKLQLTEQNEELQRANEILAQLSITDGLTKLHNHRFFQDHLTREIKRVDRTGEPLSMLLLDLDDFKRLNDRHGHAAGDEVLMNIAGRLNENVRESDLLARYGGEEFVILAPNTDIRGAVALAEKIRMSVEAMPQIVDDSMRPIRVTVSCGVAQYQGDRRRFFQAADRALYRAKGDGKNCVISASEPD